MCANAPLLRLTALNIVKFGNGSSTMKAQPLIVKMSPGFNVEKGTDFVSSVSSFMTLSPCACQRMF